MKYIIIKKGAELLRVPPDKLVYVQADGNYSKVITLDNRSWLVGYQLGQIEDMIEGQLCDDGIRILRVGRGLLINIDYIYAIDVTKQLIILSDCAGCYHELSASKEVLIKIKAYIESLNEYENE